jgi:hypothetical protein
MSEKITIEDQINYLESYANMIKSQHDMLQVQIKFLKAGKNMQENFKPFQNMFEMMNPYLNKKI